MSDERDRDAFNNAQCPEFFAGWQCIREPGHSGEHRSRAVGPGMIDARPVSVPEPCIYVSAERAILLQDLIDGTAGQLRGRAHVGAGRPRGGPVAGGGRRMSGEYDDGYDIGVRAVSRILLDLLAELRRYPVGDVLDMSDRYEARLREVDG